MLRNIKYIIAVIISFWYLGLFYELDYYFLKNAFYLIRNWAY